MTRRRVLLFSGLGLMVAFFVLWPTVNAFRVRHSLATVIDGASSIRLEEFIFHEHLASVELPAAEWSQVLAATPVVPDIGWPGSIKMCFIPHHRIVITDKQHQQFAFTVCFACDQAHTKSMGIFATPYLWYTPLRRLFTTHGIRIRTGREYNEAFTEHTPRA